MTARDLVCSVCGMPRHPRELLVVAETGGLRRTRLIDRPNVSPLCFRDGTAWRGVERIAELAPTRYVPSPRRELPPPKVEPSGDWQPGRLAIRWADREPVAWKGGEP